MSQIIECACSQQTGPNIRLNVTGILNLILVQSNIPSLHFFSLLVYTCLVQHCMALYENVSRDSDWALCRVSRGLSALHCISELRSPRVIDDPSILLESNNG